MINFFKIARKLRMSMVFPSSKNKNSFLKSGYKFHGFTYLGNLRKM